MSGAFIEGNCSGGVWKVVNEWENIYQQFMMSSQRKLGSILILLCLASFFKEQKRFALRASHFSLNGKEK